MPTGRQAAAASINKRLGDWKEPEQLVFFAPNTYVRLMRQGFEFALPVKAAKVPFGPDWLHEIKHDGYRMMVIREQKAVRPRAATTGRSAFP